MNDAHQTVKVGALTEDADVFKASFSARVARSRSL